MQRRCWPAVNRQWGACSIYSAYCAPSYSHVVNHRLAVARTLLVLLEDIQVPEQQAAPLVPMANILFLLLPRVRIVVPGNILTHLKLPQKDLA